jgi:hypothetical protein
MDLLKRGPYLQITVKDIYTKPENYRAAWQLFSSDSPRLDGLTINLGGNS